MNRTTRYLAGGLLTLALAGGSAGAAVAASDAGSATAAPAMTLSTAAPSTAHAHHLHWRRFLRRRVRELLRHSVHADFVVKHKGTWITISVDRGKLDQATSSSISLTRADGVTVSAQVTSSTKFFGIPENRLAAGDRVIVAQSGGKALDVLAFHPRAGSTSATATVS
ncbi:MAG TPA: hypothetical protein VKU92_11625 [Acidimicrobiales bacterium]|nr:hypothetical protein [Acidimicrobiales bacterium]